MDFGEPIGREQAGRRPALVVSEDALNEGPAGLVIVVPITSTRRGLPSHVELDDAMTGLDEVSYAKGEDVKSVSQHRLVVRLGVAPPAGVATSSGSCGSCCGSETGAAASAGAEASES